VLHLQQVVLDELARDVLGRLGAAIMQPSTPTKGLLGWPPTLGMGATPKSIPLFFALSQAQGPEIIIATWPREKLLSISA
jgi:hypothetical protein